MFRYQICDVKIFETRSEIFGIYHLQIWFKNAGTLNTPLSSSMSNIVQSTFASFFLCPFLQLTASAELQQTFPILFDSPTEMWTVKTDEVFTWWGIQCTLHSATLETSRGYLLYSPPTLRWMTGQQILGEIVCGWVIEFRVGKVCVGLIQCLVKRVMIPQPLSICTSHVFSHSVTTGLCLALYINNLLELYCISIGESISLKL